MDRVDSALKHELYRERAVGCLVGLAVGDALGDLGRMDEYRQRYGIVTSLYDGAGRPGAACRSTSTAHWPRSPAI